jgi:hypothetical protein
MIFSTSIIDGEGDCPLDGDTDIDSTDNFKVTITETLKLTVAVEADNQQEAEQIVSDNWRKSEYLLDADNFVL